MSNRMRLKRKRKKQKINMKKSTQQTEKISGEKLKHKQK